MPEREPWELSEDHLEGLIIKQSLFNGGTFDYERAIATAAAKHATEYWQGKIAEEKAVTAWEIVKHREELVVAIKEHWPYPEPLYHTVWRLALPTGYIVDILEAEIKVLKQHLAAQGIERPEGK